MTEDIPIRRGTVRVSSFGHLNAYLQAEELARHIHIRTIGRHVRFSDQTQAQSAYRQTFAGFIDGVNWFCLGSEAWTSWKKEFTP